VALDEEQLALLADAIGMRGPELAEYIIATTSDPHAVADALEIRR